MTEGKLNEKALIREIYCVYNFDKKFLLKKGDMNLRELEYLVALAEHKHFGKAAEVCFVSQPALSMQIKKLENYLGVQLLERTNKSVVLTEIGKRLANKANEILKQAKELKEIASLAKDPYSGELKIGIIPTLAPYLLPHIMKPLKKSFPKLKIFLIEEQTHNLIAQLKEGKLDTIILALPLAEEIFVTSHLFKEEFMLAVPPSHPFVKKKIIHQTALENEDLLLLEEGHCLRTQILEICKITNAQESKSFRATSLETLRHMVGAGMGITLIPKLARKNNDMVTYLEFKNPKPFRQIGIAWRESTAKAILLTDIAKTIRETIKNESHL